MGRRAARVEGQPAGRRTRPEVPLAPRWGGVVGVGAVAAVTAIGVVVISPRFGLDRPSLIDDWAALDQIPQYISEVVRLRNPEETRSRLSWLAYSYVQWHTFDAPGLVGPNAWNLGRLALLVGGLWALTLVLLPRSNTVTAARLRPAIAGIAPLFVVTMPAFAIDLARFGPQEPALVGGMALGMAGIVVVARGVLSGEPFRRPLAWSALGIAGALLWAYGVYHKETALCILVMAPFLLLAAWPHRRVVTRLSRGRRAALCALVLAVLAPLVHVAVQVATIVVGGDVIYDMQPDVGPGAIREALIAIRDASSSLGSPLASVLLVIAAVVFLVRLRRRRDWVEAGLALVALATIVLAAKTGVVVSRYYLPAIAIGGLVFARLVASMSPRTQPVALVAVVVVSIASAVSARADVKAWARGERAGERLVEVAASSLTSGCRVAVTGLGQERAIALRTLVAIAPARPGPCGSDEALLVVGFSRPDPDLLAACPPSSRRRLEATPLEVFYVCHAGELTAKSESVIRRHELSLGGDGGLHATVSRSVADRRHARHPD